MYDATGKQSSGIFWGATTWTGNYEECLNIMVDQCKMYQGGACSHLSQPAPHFCSIHMKNAPWMPKLISSIHLPFPVPPSPFIVDACLPVNCTSKDIHSIVDAFLRIDDFNDNITVKSVLCHHKTNITEDAPAFICLIILCIILAMVVFGTSYDIYRRRNKLRIKHGPEITIGYDKESEHYGILKILVNPRKRRRRRATLSSSDHMDHEVDKSQQGNGGASFKSISEAITAEETVQLTSYNRSLSTSPPHGGHFELEDIPEGRELKDKNQNTTTSMNNVNGADGDGIDMMSDDGFSDVTDTTEKSPMAGERNSIVFTPKVNRQHSIVEVRPSHRSKKLSSSDNIFTDLLLSFSFRKNTRHILADGSVDTLYCLNGIRVLSIAWIVLGNVYGTIFQNPDIVDNHVSAIKLTQTWWMQLVINTTLAADSFFVLSGTLGAYNFLKIKTKAGKNKEKDWRKVMSIKEYFFMIVHRLVRILPCYAVLLMLGTNMMPYLGEGPRWSTEIKNVQVCKKNWWSNVLFISNFYQPDDMCLPHTYYLANDFQFFLLSPLVLIPLLIYPKIGLSLIGFFVTVQIVVVSVLNQGINGNVLKLRMNNYWSLIYVKPYSRIGIYCIGLGLGYFLFVCDRQMKFRKFILYGGWILSCLVLFMLPYITHVENREGGQPWTGMQTAMYEAFSRPAWAFALAWVIFACSTGQGAFVGKFLSWNLFLPLCRITYGVFLLHPILIHVVIESSYHNFYLNLGQLLYTYIALFLCSYALAFLLISCVECPFTTFESHVRLRFKTWRTKRNFKNLQRRCDPA
ncbi:nose resistant to fluoxetine protein 6-like [Physella acuta]|uniref:nose resistant to fluoxetine protein 6-like n=1 Tax=Physella acuta TaxID=109671 RepID=UPI0027DD8B48|nr:nose resistant to fluoxetine protein 6-like [Physella acuta]